MVAFNFLCGSVLVFLASQLCSEGALAEDKTISYAFIYSGGGIGGFNSSGSVPAIELAEEMIRANGTILAGYNLTHTTPLDSECERTASLNQFFQSVPSSDPPVLALLGSGCSVATEPVAEIVHHWNISQVSYSSASIVLDNRERFPTFFRTSPSLANFVPAFRSVIESYGWRRVMFLTQEENLFTATYNLLNNGIRNSLLNVTLESQRIESGSPIRLPADLFRRNDDFRVFFLNSYSAIGRAVICEAFKMNLTYPRYAWLTYGWYQDRWWTEKVNPNPVDCTDQELETIVERTLALQVIPTALEPSAPTDTGLSADRFFKAYNSKLRNSSFQYTHVSILAYDAVWALAIALNHTANMIANLTLSDVQDMTNCTSDVPGSELVPLENFTYANPFLTCVIRWNLARTNFVGVSGPVTFSATGSRVQSRIAERQYRNINGTFVQVPFGIVDLANGSKLTYVMNESEMTVYPMGIPPDGTPINITVTYHLALVITYDIIAFLGLIFTTICLVFNFAFRNRMIVRLTSPNLNYFLIIGCYLLFISVFFGPLPSTDVHITKTHCHLQNWLVIVGYTLAFSTVLSKMVRVFHIFNNPTTKKQTLTDWSLVIIIVGLTSFAILLLIIGSAVPQLQPIPGLIRSEEDNSGMDELGVRIFYFTWKCYSNNAFYWVIVTFTYLVLLQVIGFILAVQTRKVKVKALNDSKYVAAVIYVTSIVLILVIVVTFALSDYLNISEVIFSGALMVGTTAFLCLMFVPKMMSLYRDPQGKNVFDKSQPTSTIEVGKSGAMAIKSKPDDEQIQQLQEKIKELELIIASGNSKPRASVVRFDSTPSQHPPDTYCVASNSQNSSPLGTDSF